MNKLNVIIKYMYALSNVKFVSAEAEFIYHSVELLRKETIKIKFIGCALYVNLFYQEKPIAL